jgi:hypothetical protein
MRSWRRFLVVASILLMVAMLLPAIPVAAQEPPPAPSETPETPPSPTADPAQPEAPEPTPTEPPEAPEPTPTEPPLAPEPTPTEAPVTPEPTEAPVTPAADALPPAPEAPAPAVVEPPRPTAPTYTIFATREGLVGHRTANGHRIRPRDRFVALPSWSVLSSRDGYEFQVRVTYRDRSVVLPVWDVGPWNTRDDYWNQNRRYSDLPPGLPMAQAARQQGYNGGRDEFGRRIRMPNGIDIADGAFWDDLGMVHEDWVEVTFLWLGEDPVAGGVAEAASDERAVIEPDAVVVDDGAPGYDAPDGKWYDAACGLNGRHGWTYGTPDAAESNTRATWQPAPPEPGLYELFAFIPSCGERPTSSARYRVTHDGAVTEVLVDQGAAVGGWASLGVYHMGDGPSAVELSDLTGDEGRPVRFDAVKLLRRGDTLPPDARVSEAQLQPDGALLVRWSGTDDVSGIASFDVQVRRLPDGGWTEWQRGATTGEALFVPPGPGEYAFRARARDWLGHEQPWREEHDLTVSVGP